jgi:hypothetical protein
MHCFQTDYPLAKLGRHFFSWAAYLRMFAESLHPQPNGLDGPLRGILALGSEKIKQAGHIQQCRL